MKSLIALGAVLASLSTVAGARSLLSCPGSGSAAPRGCCTSTTVSPCRSAYLAPPPAAAAAEEPAAEPVDPAAVDAAVAEPVVESEIVD